VEFGPRELVGEYLSRDLVKDVSGGFVSVVPLDAHRVARL